ncbi:MAG: hypothetical protein WD750_05775 [Gammaproteobacteria bacterium]
MKADEKVKVRITAEGHRHRGKPCPVNDVIEVSPGAADRLVKKERGEKVSGGSKAPLKSVGSNDADKPAGNNDNDK